VLADRAVMPRDRWAVYATLLSCPAGRGSLTVSGFDNDYHQHVARARRGASARRRHIPALADIKDYEFQLAQSEFKQATASSSPSSSSTSDQASRCRTP
jgi:hypothetical protein